MTSSAADVRVGTIWYRKGKERWVPNRADVSDVFARGSGDLLVGYFDGSGHRRALTLPEFLAKYEPLITER